MFLFLTHSLSVSSFREKAKSIFINFLIPWFVCLRSFSVCFKNGQDYLTREKLFLCLFHWWYFCWRALFREVFLFFRGTLFWFFHLFQIFWWCLLPILPSTWHLLFSESSLILCWFGRSMTSAISLSPLFIINLAHFSMPNSIPISCWYIPNACIKSPFSFFFLFFCK